MSKAYLIFGFLSFLIVFTSVSHTLITIKNPESKNRKEFVFNLFLSLPPIIIVVVLADALFKLKDYMGYEYTISRK